MRISRCFPKESEGRRREGRQRKEKRDSETDQAGVTSPRCKPASSRSLEMGHEMAARTRTPWGRHSPSHTEY